MKIIIEGDAKELAALVVAIQERRSQDMLVIQTHVPDGHPNDLVEKYRHCLKVKHLLCC